MAVQMKVQSVTEDIWEAKAALFADYNLYQTWAYQNARTCGRRQWLSGVEISDNNGLCLLALARIISFPWIRFRVGYLQWGPLLRRKGCSVKIHSESLRLLRDYYLSQGINVLRIVPNIYAAETDSDYKNRIIAAGFEPVERVKRYHTMLFPLDIDEEQMRLKFQNKWRASLRKAEKNGMAVFETQDIQTLYEFEKIYKHSQKRKQFKGLNIQEFIRTQQHLQAEKKLNLIVVKKEDQLLSVDINSYLGDTALGLFQSTTESGLSLGASYLAWWHTFLAAKRAGMRRYDMGGIDPVGNPNVYQYKQRMGGEEGFHLGCFEAYASPWARRLWLLIDGVYSKLKGR